MKIRQATTYNTWVGVVASGYPGSAANASDTLADWAKSSAADNRDAAALDRISYWDAGAPRIADPARGQYAQSHAVAGNRASD